MKGTKQWNRMNWVLAGIIAAALGTFSSKAEGVSLTYKKVNVAFHGYLEANYILRDTNGFQQGFMNQTEGIQQRNTLKFDVDIRPGLQLGSFSLDKFHLTYRGAYDTIFDIRSKEYGKIRRQGGPSKFDLGKDDIQVENDLREAFFDVVYTGSLGTCFVRPGKQLISWGETLGITIIDTINPPDNSFQMFFLNPDDLKIPLWMVRVNYSLPPMKFVYLNVDGLYIPEIRPLQFGPLDQSMDAPYVRILPFAAMPGAGIQSIQYDVPTNNTAFAIKLSADIGANLSISAVYLKHLGTTPGVSLTDFALDPSQPTLFVPRTAYLGFFMTETYGGFFNYYLQFLDIVLQGEFGRTNNVPLALPTMEPDLAYGPNSPIPGLIPERVVTYRMKPVMRWMLGFAKDLKWRWFSDTNINFAVQWIHARYGEWEEIFDDSPIPKNNDLFVTMMNWYWFHAKINPMIMVMADTTENFMSQTSVLWTISKNWYVKVALQAFWGDRDTKSQFAAFVGGPSELTLKVGFQW